MPKISWSTGVYCFLNVVTGKRYVGSAAKGFDGRIGYHLRSLRGSYHYNRHLQFAWNKYGEDNFIILYLERCCPSDCLVREQYWMDFYKSADKRYGYNLSPTAGSPLGVKHTRETRKRVSEAGKDRRFSEEHKRKIGEANRHRVWTNQTREKMSQAKKGKSYEEIFGPRAGEMKKCRSKESRGRVRSEEAIAKLRKSLTGRKLSAEHRANMSKARAGKTYEELYGAKLAAVIRKKQSDAHLLRSRA